MNFEKIWHRANSFEKYVYTLKTYNVKNTQSINYWRI